MSKLGFIIIADEAHRSQYKVMVQNIQSSSKCLLTNVYSCNSKCFHDLIIIILFDNISNKKQNKYK
jgi:type I site-specific restriction-modification system R (restriction) subunit